MIISFMRDVSMSAEREQVQNCTTSMVSDEESSKTKTLRFSFGQVRQEYHG